MNQRRKIIWGVLVMVVVACGVFLLMSDSEEFYWQKRVAKVHEGMTRAEVEQIMPRHIPSKLTLIRRWFNRRILQKPAPLPAFPLVLPFAIKPDADEMYEIDEHWDVRIHYSYSEPFGESSTGTNAWQYSAKDRVVGNASLVRDEE